MLDLRVPGKSAIIKQQLIVTEKTGCFYDIHKFPGEFTEEVTLETIKGYTSGAQWS